MFVGGLFALLIVAALAFDVGMMLVERRDQQNAADAAALAGARYVLTSPGDAETAARRIALENGFDDADSSEVVNVYIPAIHGRYAGLPGFIEVQIEGTRPSIFGGVIGRATWPVSAFALPVFDAGSRPDRMQGHRSVRWRGGRGIRQHPIELEWSGLRGNRFQPNRR
jgi:hypothetical protein